MNEDILKALIGLDMNGKSKKYTAVKSAHWIS